MTKFVKDQIYALHTGYCMQETRFYQVVGFTKSGKSAIVQRLERYESGKPGFIVAYKDRFAEGTKPRTLRITSVSSGECVRVGYQDYLFAGHPWDGEPETRDYSINFENRSK